MRKPGPKQTTTILWSTLDNALKNAPRALIYRYEHPNPFRGKDILGRLLTDPRMKRAWKEIGKRGDPDYPRLWSQIYYAFVKSNTTEPSRTKMRKHFKGIAKDAENLAGSIAGGPLDHLAYEFFPDDKASLAIKEDEWPSMTDLLAEISRHAERHAKQALTNKRFAERNTADRNINFFVRYLESYFRKHLNGPMHGSLANITSVVFDKPIDRVRIKQALRHKGGA